MGWWGSDRLGLQILISLPPPVLPFQLLPFSPLFSLYTMYALEPDLTSAENAFLVRSEKDF